MNTEHVGHVSLVLQRSGVLEHGDGPVPTERQRCVVHMGEGRRTAGEYHEGHRSTHLLGGPDGDDLDGEFAIRQRVGAEMYA